MISNIVNMNLIKKLTLLTAAAVAVSVSAAAQDSSSSGVVRRAERNRADAVQQGPQVTQRMQSFYNDEPGSDADLQWMRVIYRQLDLQDPKNAPLYFPEDVVDGQENLFRIIMRLLADNRIAAYDYLDGKEIFNDQHRLNVRDMLDRFHVLYTDAKGSTEKNPRFVIEESDVPAYEVLSYYIIERWEFDSRSNQMKVNVDAICPVLHRSGDFGGDAVKYPMFWVKLDALRPYMAQQDIFIDDDNNLATHTYDDFFQMTMYEGEIYKTRNLANKSMMQLYPDPDDRKRAQDSIQARLDGYEKKLWVPSREEVIAAREAREAAEAAAAGVDIPARDASVDNSKSDNSGDKRTVRSSRGKKKAPKAKKAPKQPKQSSSSATRSVRRRK